MHVIHNTFILPQTQIVVSFLFQFLYQKLQDTHLLVEALEVSSTHTETYPVKICQPMMYNNMYLVYNIQFANLFCHLLFPHMSDSLRGSVTRGGRLSMKSSWSNKC